MEKREDLRSILPYLGVVVEGSSVLWPSPVIEPLKAISRGPDHSGIHSGELLFLAISDLRHSLSLSSQRLSASAPHGYALFFDKLLSRPESSKWFAEVLPALANLLLRFPSLLEFHYRNADTLIDGVQTGLRILDSQQSGIVFLSQELIGALLTCSFFCLFPITNRDAKHLPMINFDHLFSCLYDIYDEKMENKIKCIVHYFERICSQMPTGLVSFERKVLPLEDSPFCVTYPKADLWSKSAVPLCHFEVHRSGLIEDQSKEALEVDFANRYIGGGALRRGCVQEEIRFMINPELIAGMLFLPSMADNEAIEVVGPERFSNYTGEINKAFCGFFDQSKCQQYQRLFKGDGLCGAHLDQGVQGPDSISWNNLLLQEAPYASVGTNEGIYGDQQIRNAEEKGGHSLGHRYDIGVVTGNWGCGAFGGDPELKTIIQWLAASQALRPFISYHTFGVEALKTLDKVIQWILSHKWTVGDLWDMLVEYSTQRLRGETSLGFFTWLLPSLSAPDATMMDMAD
ncbi:poly(ADP-ribose) glycohydrolase 1 isoform X2 [Vitis vinifera]|uniref:poly(ADP-ribose) glycohydrolase 1 isoform X2 n=1 Tax=Vitis vinifera TaxID=29760 RepID=UPI00054035AB|nr:poly(ADP-ribose) glycohydrolase 1 isoform X2 [Vitis vinifera]|eukprot:XP_010650755.1 PREDICTED: poly(ADP-ribose) glycohydrolase 1 isoform X2 [Vitis vinifera]